MAVYATLRFQLTARDILPLCLGGSLTQDAPNGSQDGLPYPKPICRKLLRIGIGRGWTAISHKPSVGTLGEACHPKHRIKVNLKPIVKVQLCRVMGINHKDWPPMLRAKVLFGNFKATN